MEMYSPFIRATGKVITVHTANGKVLTVHTCNLVGEVCIGRDEMGEGREPDVSLSAALVNKAVPVDVQQHSWPGAHWLRAERDARHCARRVWEREACHGAPIVLLGK